jgi:hypothetical protein
MTDLSVAISKENAKNFKQSLSSLKRRRHFVTWGESGAFACELASMLESLQATVTDPKTGVESVAAFYKADQKIFDQCDDSNGSVGDIFRVDAADLFVSYASRCEDKEWLVKVVLDLNQDDGYGVRDALFERMSQYLPEHVMRSTVDKLWSLANAAKTDSYKGKHWFFAIDDLAKQLKDPQLLEKSKRAQTDGELPSAYMIEIAKLHFDCVCCPELDRACSIGTILHGERARSTAHCCLSKAKQFSEAGGDSLASVQA